MEIASVEINPQSRGAVKSRPFVTFDETGTHILHYASGEGLPPTSRRIAVFGLGYVGAVSAACLAALGHTVTGVDVNAEKVSQINAGGSPIVEFGLDTLLADATRRKRLSATVDLEEAVAASDIALICVGTPSSPNGSLDTSYIERVMAQIGSVLRHRDRRFTVVVRSTLLPGTTETLLQPLLEEAAGKRCGSEIGLAYNPEFLRESTAIRDFVEPPFTVAGAADPLSAEAAAGIYEMVAAPIHHVKIREAEMIKYAANAFHALKITFANEIGNFSKASGVDGHRVMELITQDTKLNISPAYMKPGFAFGGSCLPKDLRALVYAAQHKDVELPMLRSLLPSNALQIQRGIDLVASQSSRKVGVLGFSFKSGTDDLRESPVVRMIEYMIGKGYDVVAHDKNVNLMRLTGKNQHFINSTIPHIAELMRDSVAEVLATSDVIVIGNNSPEFSQIFAEPLDKTVIDLVRFPGITPEWLDAMAGRYLGVCW